MSVSFRWRCHSRRSLVGSSCNASLRVCHRPLLQNVRIQSTSDESAPGPDLSQTHLFVCLCIKFLTSKQPRHQSAPITLTPKGKGDNTGALHCGRFSHSTRPSWLPPVRPTFELIRPSQFLRCPPGTAEPPAHLIGSFVQSCFAEQRQNERKCCSGTIVSTLVSKDKRKWHMNALPDR